LGKVCAAFTERKFRQIAPLQHNQIEDKVSNVLRRASVILKSVELGTARLIKCGGPDQESLPLLAALRALPIVPIRRAILGITHLMKPILSTPWTLMPALREF
jgi:hypothetical protein